MTFLQKVSDAKELIAWSLNEYPKLCIGCSFGKDSMVTLHLARSVSKDIPVIAIMAETEFKETIDFAHRMEKEWQLPLTTYTFAQQGEGENCCGKQKVAMTKEALI